MRSVILVATNAFGIQVWKFNPYHDYSTGRFSSGGGGGGGGRGGYSTADVEAGTKVMHESLLPKTIPNGVAQGTASFEPSSRLFGVGSRDVETSFQGSKGSVVFRTEPIHGGNNFKGAHVIRTKSGLKRFSGELAYTKGISPVTLALTKALNGIA